jgi:hypothetical protein
MNRFFLRSSVAVLSSFATLAGCSIHKSPTEKPEHKHTISSIQSKNMFMAQVVGVQWLNPLQRADYSTEWQLLWTLGLVGPNKDDDMVKSDPQSFSSVKAVASIAAGNEGRETFHGYHMKYVESLIYPFHGRYFSDSNYFYNAHSLTDKRTWRELAGIHVEYALPKDRIAESVGREALATAITKAFSIGNVNAPTLWTKATPPDVRVTLGGANAGFSSLAAALTYLEKNPNETAWVMNWDAPSRPLDEQINENMVLLVLAGPNYKTERAALAWIGYPSSKSVAAFNASNALPSTVQAWQSAIADATHNANKKVEDIGYVIHDANSSDPDSSQRIGALAQTLTLKLPALDYLKQTFNTPALLGDMGAGTALTNVALGIAYANHFGKSALIAGTTEPDQLTAVLVAPPAVIRPIKDEPWMRARSRATAYLPWWGLRHDEPPHVQGYSR